MKTKFCFLDMDGVIADFIGGILKVHGKESPYNPKEKGLWNIGDYWNMSNDEMMKPTHQPGFWETLEVIPGSFEMVYALMDIFGVDNICILSSPAKNSVNCIPEKIKWLQKYFPEIAERKNYFFGSKKGFMGAEGNWLVDDGDFNVDDFEAAGGNGLLFPQPWNRLFPKHYELGWFQSMNSDQKYQKYKFVLSQMKNKELKKEWKKLEERFAGCYSAPETA